MGIKIAIDWENMRKKPINIMKHFSRTSSIHSYPTRCVGVKTQNEILPNDFKMLSKKAFSEKNLKLHYLTF